jgi:hypothetical protein
MSRRKALWQFITSLGVVAAFTGGRTAYARDRRHRCEHFCEEQARQFLEACLEYARCCPEGSCPEFTGGLCLNYTLINLDPVEVSFNGAFTCFYFNGAIG